jgi:hypothetical protein
MIRFGAEIAVKISCMRLATPETLPFLKKSRNFISSIGVAFLIVVFCLKNEHATRQRSVVF